ncbi:LacI family DNA-binding transcriptional regulator [Streptomyces sp. NPDC056105]|uniref:LacI family DNA-binding transcriptional regulator n=1 Tax=Streptomyces sp. NPDC056105 TaxID=3345714 RepID=UPI0035E30640
MANSSKPGRRPTIADIATAAGVSKPTVSRVLNGHRDVAEATRRRVQDVAAEMGYTPSADARALRTGRHGAIGLLMPPDYWWGFGEVQYGIAREAARNGLRLLIQPPLPETPEAEEEFAKRTLPGLPVDGLILLMPYGMLRHIGDLARSGTPVAVIDDRGYRPGIPFVETTNREGMRAMGEHLTAHGRTRIAFVTGSANAAFAQSRFEGYLDALRAAGLEYRPELVCLSQEWEPSLAEIDAVLEHGPDAVMCGWDEIAFQVLGSLHKQGRAVPDEVAVTGFDDSPIASASLPALTTVHQPLRRMGRAAVRMLVDSIEHGTAPANASVPTTLSIRESCGSHLSG